LTNSITLLVAEDEPLLRLSMELALGSGGFEVITARNGEAALSILACDQNRVTGLITDIRLGVGVDGWALARQARELIPDICVVYVTGDSVGDWSAQGVPGSIVLQKPVADAQLLTGIAMLLNDRPRLT
jgi:CheY-like chemotaxis protein